MYAAKLVHNINNWVSVSGYAQTGITVNINIKKSYYFGLEEWINNPILRKMKVGYLDCYRASIHLGLADKIALFSYDPRNTNIYHVGNVYGVEQLNDNNIPAIYPNLNPNNWLNQVEHDFHNIGDLRAILNHIEYMHCWNALHINDDIGNAFILNIRYKEIEFFEPSNRVNITHLNRLVNNKWKRLSRRYTVPVNWEIYF